MSKLHRLKKVAQLLDDALLEVRAHLIIEEGYRTTVVPCDPGQMVNLFKKLCKEKKVKRDNWKPRYPL